MTNYDINVYLYYDGGYHLLDPTHVAAAGVTWSRGVTEELDFQKSVVSWRLIDDTDQYRPTNPASALYGKIGPYLPFAALVGSVPRAAGELETLTPDQTEGHQATAGVTTRGVRWVDVTASDPLATIGKWREDVSSPMRLHILGMATLACYWPGEDGEDADRMSAAAGAPAATVGAVEFAAEDGPPGSNPLMKLGAAGAVSGEIPAAISPTGWQISWCTNMTGADATERLVFAFYTSQGWWWKWYASTTTYRLTVSQFWGADLLDLNVTNSGIGPGADVVTRLKCSRSGSTWTVEAAWWKAGDTVLAGTTWTFSGGTGRPISWEVGANTIMNGAYLGHVFVVTTTAEDLQSDAALQAINGYPNESTAARFGRLCTLRRIPYEVRGTTARAAKMHHQRTGSIKAQLQEIQRTEMGLIFPSRSGRGLVLALRDYLYTQAQSPALSLTFPTHADPIQEVSTAVGLFNTVIVRDRSGVQATAVQTAGRYGTAEPPTGMGVVDRTVDVNYYDAGNVPHAARTWLKFHQASEKFGDILVDLDANPSLKTAVEGLDLGQFITLTGRTPDPQTLMVLAISGRDQYTRYTNTFSTVPGAVFAIAAWNGGQKWGLASCTVSAGVSASATSITLKITDDEAWSTTPGYGLMIAGERVTVTAMGARTGGPGAYQQIASVTRAVNGVSKAQIATTPVTVYNPGRWGW